MISFVSFNWEYRDQALQLTQLETLVEFVNGLDYKIYAPAQRELCEVFTYVVQSFSHKIMLGVQLRTFLVF